MTGDYHDVLIETFHHHGERSKHSIRARPLAGQGLPTSMRVECSSSMREQHPVGSIFKVSACVKGTEMMPHLYTPYGWTYDVLSSAQAKKFIRAANQGK